MLIKAFCWEEVVLEKFTVHNTHTTRNPHRVHSACTHTVFCYEIMENVSLFQRIVTIP